MSKTCPKIVFAVPPDNFWTFFGHFFDNFQTFCRHSLFWAVQRFARYKLRLKISSEIDFFDLWAGIGPFRAFGNRPARFRRARFQTPPNSVSWLSGRVRPRQGTKISNFGALSPLDLLSFPQLMFFPCSSGDLSDCRAEKKRRILSRLWLSCLFSLGQESCRTKVSRVFEFSSRILPRILLRIFPEFFKDFSCFVSWETETRKNSPKIPTIFQCKFPGKHEKNIHKMFWREGQVIFRSRG